MLNSTKTKKLFRDILQALDEQFNEKVFILCINNTMQQEHTVKIFRQDLGEEDFWQNHGFFSKDTSFGIREVPINQTLERLDLASIELKRERQ